MRLQKDQWGIPRSLENVQSRGQKQRLELFLPCACKWVKDVLWAPGQHERGALSNRDLLCASEEASWGPGREHIAAPNGGPISSREFFFNFSNSNILVVVQLLNYFWLFATPWTAASQASLSFTIFWSLLTLMSIESVMPSRRQNESTSCWNPIMCVWWIQTTENVGDLGWLCMSHRSFDCASVWSSNCNSTDALSRSVFSVSNVRRCLGWIENLPWVCNYMTFFIQTSIHSAFG